MLGLNDDPVQPPKLEEIKKERNYLPMLIGLITAAVATVALYATYVLRSGPK